MMPRSIIFTVVVSILIFPGSFCFASGDKENLSRGKELKKAGNCAEAVGFLLEAAKGGKKFAEAYIQMGLCYEKLGKKGKAYRAYRQVGKHPKYGAEAIFYIAQLYIKEKRYVEAAKVFLTLNKDHPKSVWAHPAMERAGWCYQKSGKRRKAYGIYLKLLESAKEEELREEIRSRIKNMGYYLPPEDGQR